MATNLNSPKGIVSPMHRAGAGQFSHYLYVAVSNDDIIVKVDKEVGGATDFATSSDFPVGVSFFGGPFGEYLYVGNAFNGGIKRVDPSGVTTDFALTGKGIAGMDFGRGKYGNYLYAGEYAVGKIWRLDPAGNNVDDPNPFAEISGVQTRYLKFSPGKPELYFTDFTTGKIYTVSPAGDEDEFATVPGGAGLEGFDFGPGGAFPGFMYVGSIGNTKIWVVDAAGVVTEWATGFPGVADIYFEPGQEGGFVMYVVTGQTGPGGNVYAISKE